MLNPARSREWDPTYFHELDAVSVGFPVATIKTYSFQDSPRRCFRRHRHPSEIVAGVVLAFWIPDHMLQAAGPGGFT